MKKIFFLLPMFFAIHSFAQKEGNISLKKGQTITAVSSVSANTDMGMGMSMKNSSTSTNILSVIDDQDKMYKLSNTITKLKISMDMMGQPTSYDSEKAEDKTSDIGKELSGKLNMPDTVMLDKKNGTVIINKMDSPERTDKADDDNPLAGLFNSMGGEVDGNAAIEGAFFVLPSGKKSGDSWTDSITMNKVTKVKSYSIKSMDNNIATIIVKSKTNGEGETEMQGSNVTYIMTTNITSEMTVDIKKGLVSKNSSEIEIVGSIDVMGQTMPISSKGNSSITYQY
ncbi:MAG: DUF6263 family protein [Ferruginibacter sp.]